MARQSSNSEPDAAPDEQPEPARQRRPGRVRAAWSVLLGESLVPVQLQAEWAEYQQIFDDLLKRLSAMLARQAKAEKKRVQRLIEEAAPSAEHSTGSASSSNGSKAHLRHLAADRLGLGAFRNLAPVPPPAPENDQ